MKRIALLIISILYISTISSFAQGEIVYENGSCKITKGYAKANKNFYKLCTFMVESSSNMDIVEDILVNGVPARVKSVKRNQGVLYVVKMPAGMNVRVNRQFEVEVRVSYPDTGMPMINEATISSKAICVNNIGEADDGGRALPGGPGGLGDPTVVIIKYP